MQRTTHLSISCVVMTAIVSFIQLRSYDYGYTFVVIFYNKIFNNIYLSSIL